MTTCPWCGTHYTTFQSNCDNCGGALPLPAEQTSNALLENLRIPPPAPRALPSNYIWRLFFTDGWAIMAFVFTLIGTIFAIVGIVLTISVVAALVGLPFVGVGVLFLVIGIPIFTWRYQNAQQTVLVLQEGDPVLGEIIDVYQHYNIRVNSRYPWSILYHFEVFGKAYEGKVTTLSQPDLRQQPGNPVYILYLPDHPQKNTIYPYPYGYYGL